MKIHTDVSHALQGTDKSTTSKSGAATSTPVVATTNAVGSVNISDASRSLSATSDSTAPFDAKRVEQIKAAISSGQFKVNPEAIANKVIDSASQLLVGKA